MKILLLILCMIVIGFSTDGMLILALIGYFKKVGLSDAEAITLMLLGLSFGMYLYFVSEAINQSSKDIQFVATKKSKEFFGYTTLFMVVISSVIIFIF